ncbi:hypothetical protein HN51_024662 [Arachis hypogaea]
MALSIVWTAPLIATLGMLLNIHVAMVADIHIYGSKYLAIYICGCIQVLKIFDSHLGHRKELEVEVVVVIVVSLACRPVTVVNFGYRGEIGDNDVRK